VPGEFEYNSYVCTDDRGRQVAPGYIFYPTNELVQVLMFHVLYPASSAVAVARGDNRCTVPMGVPRDPGRKIGLSLISYISISMTLRPYYGLYTPTLLLMITPSALLWAVTMAESKREKAAKSSNGGKNCLEKGVCGEAG